MGFFDRPGPFQPTECRAVRITVDATPLLIRSAGVKGYLFHWIRGLITAAGPGAIRLFPPLRLSESLDHDRSTTGRWRTRFALRSVALARRLPLLDALGTDIFHASILTPRPPRRAKLTSTIHDLTSWRMPEVHTATNAALDRDFAERILKRADGLIAVSEHSRADAIEILGIEESRIRTIHSGVAPEYFDALPSQRSRPYVLFVGTIEPRKNLERLLDAWASLPSDYRQNWDLVVAGPRGWASGGTMMRLVRETVWLGYVAEAELPGLTAGADLLAYPSLYEGFGFPVAQAMAARVAVLTSNVSSLPEVAGPGALLVDPLSTAEIAAGLKRLLDAPDERARLARAGRVHAERYRWETCAERSLAFLTGLL